MKKIILTLLLIENFLTYAENKKGYNGIIEYSFKSVLFNDDSTVSFFDDENSECSGIWNQTFSYEISTEGKFYLLILRNKNVKKIFLALKSDYCLILYDTNNSEPVFLGMAISATQVESVYFPHHIKATSELEENNIIYEAENAANARQDFPWCEGVHGNGVGQKLEFSVNASCMVIVTGYISCTKKHLYEDNSRPKKITVNFINANKTMSYDLSDTPNPQLIDFKTNYSGTIEIIIDEVYEGVKYKDTCISCIICKY
ncbi:MAG: hypothetical protein J6K96_00530 [Treponema sp.]|nr:hypothetical protein [Treponema sp.]